MKILFEKSILLCAPISHNLLLTLASTRMYVYVHYGAKVRLHLTTTVDYTVLISHLTSKITVFL